MRLATLDDGTIDGALVLTDGERILPVPAIARTMQQALDAWDEIEPALQACEPELRTGERFVPERCLAPLPRAYEWIDGSAYLAHVRLARRARGAPLPPRLEDDPLLYQGGGGTMLGSRARVRRLDPTFGLDFEGEIGVVLRATPLGIDARTALDHIALVVLLDDLTFRGLVPAELEKGFGFLQSKPPTAFAPIARTPDSFGGAFRDGRLHAQLVVRRGETIVGELATGPEMHFSFGELIAHAARTRPLCAGTILGSGTVSNERASSGAACLVERRARETIEFGEPRTPYLDVGEVVTIDARDPHGTSLFGAIVQEVIP